METEEIKKEKKYTLTELKYKYNELEPYISEEQLRIHHTKHHKAYVDKANSIIETLEIARINDKPTDMKATLKELSFNISGHLLHSLFWKNIGPIKTLEKHNKNSVSKNMPNGDLLKAIKKEYESFERFKEEFSLAAASVEGSGWAALTYCPITKKLIMMQIEKHNVNLIPMFPILLVIDVFEHAYYIDYKNERAKFIDAFWDIINWKEVEKRYDVFALDSENIIKFMGPLYSSLIFL